ncbi:MAG: hypothetical protein H6657_25570 [Ardenticatenaceae bacterium]|nr:hypothetical protein [Ardenticatenaceae bacterium]
MSTTHLQPLLDYQFCANDAYRLISFERLAPELQAQWRELAANETFYGVLWAKDERNSNVKAVDEETALLFLTLKQPGAIPYYLQRKLGQECTQAVAELVLDGVLAVSGENGRFISGAAAHSILYQPNSTPQQQPSHPLLILSYDALQYGQKLLEQDATRLAYSLYSYNILPLTPAWRKRLADRSDVYAWLRLVDPTSASSRALRRAWAAQQPKADSSWISWQRKTSKGAQTAPYKLYVSPRPEILPDILPKIVEALSQSPAAAFKLGADAAGLLRPDKFVVYLPNFEALSETAALLENALKDTPVHGVPFTAPIDSAGLLSWGMDPPPGTLPFARHELISWRSWLCDQLAQHLLRAEETADVEPWRYALDRLALEGIDIETWVPNQSMWQPKQLAR